MRKILTILTLTLANSLFAQLAPGNYSYRNSDAQITFTITENIIVIIHITKAIITFCTFFIFIPIFHLDSNYIYNQYFNYFKLNKK